jgi:hypothetical protein
MKENSPEKKITFTLPATLLVLFKEKTGKWVQKTNLANTVSIHSGKFRIELAVFRKWIMDAGRNIIQLLNNVFEHIGLKENVNIILAGQFSNSVIFQDTIRLAFPNHYVIAEGEEVVTKGAALFGDRPVEVILMVSFM